MLFVCLRVVWILKSRWSCKECESSRPLVLWFMYMLSIPPAPLDRQKLGTTLMSSTVKTHSTFAPTSPWLLIRSPSGVVEDVDTALGCWKHQKDTSSGKMETRPRLTSLAGFPSTSEVWVDKDRQHRHLIWLPANVDSLRVWLHYHHDQLRASLTHR